MNEVDLNVILKALELYSKTCDVLELDDEKWVVEAVLHRVRYLEDEKRKREIRSLFGTEEEIEEEFPI